MTNSLVAGLAGLRVHQQLLDIVGNNLANSNTPGYKGSRATFAEILTTVIRQGTAPTSSLGGTNPQQVGLGVRLGTVDVNQNQGAFETTGRTFDMALQGSGFFQVSSGSETLYTRAGSFGLDAQNKLVDLKNGFRVLDIQGADITINTTGLNPPQETANIEVTGNLPAKVDGPKAQVLTSSTAFQEGTAAQLQGTVDEGSGGYILSSSETMTISLNGGAAVTIDIPAGTYTSAQMDTAITADLTTAGITGITVSTYEDDATPDGELAIQFDTVGTGSSQTIKVTEGTGLAATLGMSTTLVAGSETAADSSTELNDLPDNLTNYADGDQINITGTDYDGTQISATFTYGGSNDGTTLGELITFVNAQFSGATLAFETSGGTSTGNFVLTSGTTGATNLNLTISDATSATGSTSWGNHSMGITTTGTGPDTVTTSIPIFDETGLSHNLTLTFTRQDDLSWTMTSSIPASEGTIASGAGTITGITFNDDGSFLGASGNNITVNFNTTTATQSITLNFGQSGSFTGLTQFGEDATAQASSQDGFGPGSLSSISIRPDGVIQGVFTNGQISSLGSLGIATFDNPAGLERASDTSFRRSVNSGLAIVGAGGVGSAGTVVAGVLENSNVEVAEEFVNLVEAQRGFQASAKVIQTTDRLLADLNNLI